MRRFFSDESGAVTVDWVVLTAALVFFCVAVLTAIHDASITSTDNVGAILQEY
ncbi:MAG: hypothetical protein ACSHWZ_04015 [Sulfitobacter sp.]